MKIILKSNELEKLSSYLGRESFIFDICMEPLIKRGGITSGLLSEYGQKTNIEVMIQNIESLIKKNCHFFIHETLPRDQYINEWAINIPSEKQILIIGEEKQVSAINMEQQIYHIGSPREFITRQSHLIFLVLEAAKIRSSSFFLSEILNVWPLSLPCTINNNQYFPSFEDFVRFARDIGLSLTFPISASNNFQVNLNYYCEHFNIIIPKYVDNGDCRLWHNALFIPNISVTNKTNLISCDSWILQGISPTCQYTQPLVQKIEWYSSQPVLNTYWYYMFFICNLYTQSLEKIILRNVVDFLKGDRELKSFISYSMKTKIYFLRDKITIKNQQLCWKEYPLIFTLSSSRIPDIKNSLRLKKIYRFYIYDFSKGSLELHTSRNIPSIWKISLII